MTTTVSPSNVSHSLSIATAGGKAARPGATVYREGVSFSLFFRDASAVELLLFKAELPEAKLLVHLTLSAYRQQLDVELPVIANDKTFWHRRTDTYLDSPQDIVEWQTAPAILNHTFGVGSRSVVVFWTSHGT